MLACLLPSGSEGTGAATGPRSSNVVQHLAVVESVVAQSEVQCSACTLHSTSAHHATGQCTPSVGVRRRRERLVFVGHLKPTGVMQLWRETCPTRSHSLGCVAAKAGSLHRSETRSRCNLHRDLRPRYSLQPRMRLRACTASLPFLQGASLQGDAMHVHGCHGR
jgi:hypothetical protein